jgi:hypothetical protein
MRAFERQLTLSLWIFVVVVILVLSGVVFAGFQLFAGLYPPRLDPQGEPEGGGGTEPASPGEADAGSEMLPPAGGSASAKVPATGASGARRSGIATATDRVVRATRMAAAGATSSLDPTEVQLSPTSFVVKTSILGVIVLAISCAFFYLYLTVVYPIQTTPW